MSAAAASAAAASAAAPAGGGDGSAAADAAQSPPRAQAQQPAAGADRDACYIRGRQLSRAQVHSRRVELTLVCARCPRTTTINHACHQLAPRAAPPTVPGTVLHLLETFTLQDFTSLASRTLAQHPKVSVIHTLSRSPLSPRTRGRRSEPPRANPTEARLRAVRYAHVRRVARKPRRGSPRGMGEEQTGTT